MRKDTERRDQNGKRAALIKIQSPVDGLTFDAGIMGVVDKVKNNGEIWLYLPQGAKKLTINHPDYKILSEYPLENIQSGNTYEMIIDPGIGRYATITAQLDDSEIYIDGKLYGKSMVRKYLNYGPHTIRAIKDRFEGEDSLLVDKDGPENIQKHVPMEDKSYLYGDVTVTVDNKADIFFNGQNKGTGQWKGQLREGNYTIETRKDNCDPVKTSFTVKAQSQNEVKANPPVPHTGWLNIYTRPRDAKAFLNGKPVDISETQTLNVGTYQMKFTRRGYEQLEREFHVRHNETARDTVHLQRKTYVKPLAFYFGAGYSLRSLSGITGILGAVFYRHDIQFSYTFGIASSDHVYWYEVTDEGNYDFRRSCTYKMNSLALRYGYQFNLSELLAVTPQLGVSIDRMSVAESDSQQAYADGAASTCLTIGMKLLFVPFEHVYLFLSPEYDFAVKKDANFQKLVSTANISAGGFAAHAGILINF